MTSGGPRRGAGRSRQKLRSESLLRLDIRQFARLNLLRSCSFDWGWEMGQETTARIRIASTTHLLTLNAPTWTQTLAVHRTRCALGGVRPWFTCPNCGSRRAVLFLFDCKFACRACTGIGYASQSLNRLDRARRRANDLRALVHEGRPAGMHWKTYFRALRRFGQAETNLAPSFNLMIARLRRSA